MGMDGYVPVRDPKSRKGCTHHSVDTRAEVIRLHHQGLSPDLIAVEMSTPAKRIPTTTAASIVLSYERNKRICSEKQHKGEMRSSVKQLLAGGSGNTRPRSCIPLHVKNICYVLIHGDPNMVAVELQREIMHRTGHFYPVNTIQKLRLAQGFRRLRNHRPRRAADPIEQSQYKQMIINMGVQDHHWIFIDEFHRGTKEFYRLYGYYRPGLPAHTPCVGNISDAFSTLGVMTMDGMIDWKINKMSRQQGSTDRGMDTMAFLANFVEHVYPYLGNFAKNEPRSFLVLDNSSLHHDQKQLLQMLCARKGTEIVYLPPYSPNLNPIELAFNGVNQHIRREFASNDAGPDAGERVLEAALASITADKAQSYMKHMWTVLNTEVV